MNEGKIALIVTLLRIGAGKDAQLYEAWWNWHGPENRESFYDMASQEHVPIVFFTPRRDQGIQVRNAYRDLFTRAVAALTAMPAWSMSEFDQARERVYARYQTPHALWSVLTTSSG